MLLNVSHFDTCVCSLVVGSLSVVVVVVAELVMLSVAGSIDAAQWIVVAFLAH